MLIGVPAATAAGETRVAVIEASAVRPAAGEQVEALGANAHPHIPPSAP